MKKPDDEIDPRDEALDALLLASRVSEKGIGKQETNMACLKTAREKVKGMMNPSSRPIIEAFVELHLSTQQMMVEGQGASGVCDASYMRHAKAFQQSAATLKKYTKVEGS
jgi:hypothetical protein